MIRASQREQIRIRRLQIAGNIGLGTLCIILASVLVWVYVFDGPNAPDVTASPTIANSEVPPTLPSTPTPESSSAAMSLTQRTVINGQNVRLDLPTSGTVEGLALWFPGQGSNVDDRMDESWLNSIRAQGWAIASSDYHGNAWGNASAVQDAKDLIAWAQVQSGRPAGLFVSASMGSTTSLNALREGVAPFCWYGTHPVVDLGTVNALPNSAVQIASAYSYRSTEAGNPVVHLATLPFNTKYRIIASAGDTLVPPTLNGDTLELYLASRGYDVSSMTVSGDHGDASHFNDEDLATFAKGCLA